MIPCFFFSLIENPLQPLKIRAAATRENFTFAFDSFASRIQMQIPLSTFGLETRLINRTCSVIKLSRGSVRKRDEMEAENFRNEN